MTTSVVIVTETESVIVSSDANHIHDTRYYTKTEGDAKYLTDMEISPLLLTDHSYSGPISTDTVGENVVFGDFLYKKLSDDKWYKAKANAVTTVPGMRMALATALAGASCLLLCPGGIARDDSWSWTTDGTVIELWLSASVAGTLTESVDTSSGAFGQVVCTPLASNQIELAPSLIIARF